MLNEIDGLIFYQRFTRYNPFLKAISVIFAEKYKLLICVTYLYRFNIFSKLIFLQFIFSLSLDAYKRVKNELFPEELEGITYVRVRETLVKIFRKSTNIYKCRYEFNQVKKAEGEDVNGFINRLKEAARKCKFESGELQSRMLDRLVAGINSPMLVERLLNEPKLTYETEAEICWTYEVVRNTQFSGNYVNVVNEVKNNYKSGVDVSWDRGKSYVCGDAQG